MFFFPPDFINAVVTTFILNGLVPAPFYSLDYMLLVNWK